MGLEKSQPEFFKWGREKHRIVQDHVSGKKKDGRLFVDGKDLLPYFPVVEEVDFDPNLKFTSPIFWRDIPEYTLLGYMDGKNVEEGNMLELKFSSKPWSGRRFNESMQWRFYALCNDWIKNVYLFTSDWDFVSPKLYYSEVQEEDKEMARTWIDGAISIIESGNFTPPEGETCKSCFYINCPCPGCKDLKQYGRSNTR